MSSAENEIARLDQIDLRSVSVGEGLTIVGTLIRNRYYDDHRYSVAARACFDGFDTLDLPQAVPGYKPRPLKGVWATPPFLHNGSVPTIYALLSPREERPGTFYVGTHLYDPRKLGYETGRPSPKAGGFVLDTALPGNRNSGHEFRKGYVPFDESKPPETQYQGRHRAGADPRRTLRNHRVPEGGSRRTTNPRGPRAARLLRDVVGECGWIRTAPVGEVPGSRFQVPRAGSGPSRLRRARTWNQHLVTRGRGSRFQVPSATAGSGPPRLRTGRAM